MRMRITRVLGALAASAALVTGLAASAAATAATSPPKPAAPAAQAGPACRHHHQVMAYVATSDDMGQGKSGVTPLDPVTGATLKPIPVSGYPAGVVVSPDGRTAYVLAQGQPALVTVIRTRTGTVVKTIPVPGPFGMTTMIAITPNGKTVYATLGTTIVPIRTADYKVLKPIVTGVAVTGLVFTPDGRKLYVNSWDGKVVPISTATNTAGKAIVLPSYEIGIASGLAMAPNGRTVYAASGDTLTPISTATDKAGRPIRFAEQVADIVISKDGRTGYVSNLGTYGGPGKLFPVSLATGKILAPINLPGVASSMLLTPDGKTLYIMEQLAYTVTAIRTATGTVLGEIKIGSTMSYGLAVTPDGRTVYVINGTMSLTPISTATNRAGALIPLIGFPVGIAFFRR